MLPKISSKFYLRIISTILSIVITPVFAILDDDGDGMSDIWEEKYRAFNLLPDIDTDGDGQSNLEESQAGTDPGNPNANIGVVRISRFENHLNVHWQTRPGTFSSLESGLTMRGADWQPQGPFEPSSGYQISLPVDFGETKEKFYRLANLNHIGESSRFHSLTGKNYGPSFAKALFTDPSADNPFYPDSIGISKQFITLSWQTEPGKYYSIFLSSENSSVESLPLVINFPGTGKIESYSLTETDSLNQNRLTIEVTDIDSDGDQLSDWEELAIGTDPRNSQSNPDGNGDLDQVRRFFIEDPVLNISSPEAVANITRNSSGVIRVTRSGGIREVWANYVISGSAKPGIDYHQPPGTSEYNGLLFGIVKIPFGISSVDIEIKPMPGSAVELSSSVVVTLDCPQGLEKEEENYGIATVNVVREVALNVKDFGAVGDGLQDDTEAIQLALDTLEASQDYNTLNFPEGTYRLNNPSWDNYTVTSEWHLLTFGTSDLEGRDLFFTGEPGSRLYSTVSPTRAHMMVVLATFRSISSFGMTWQKDDELLSPKAAGSEPNGADGVSLVAIDNRIVEHVRFHECKFINCHGALMTTANGIDRRGHLRQLGFYNCQFLNPFGSNTKDGGVAWGGGQQTYLSQWVGRAIYDANLFEGGGEDMTDSNYTEGGKLKDAAMIGGPVVLEFTNNIVRRMGIEAVFLGGGANYMNHTIEAVAIPRADGTEIATISVNPKNTPSTFIPGSQINIRIPTTSSQSGIDNLFEVVDFDPESKTVSFVNTGYPGNSPEGFLIPKGSDIYLSEPSARPLSLITGNLLEGAFPVGSDSQSYSVAVTVNSRALVANNRISGWKIGVMSYIDGQPYHRATGLIVRDNLITLKDTSDLVNDAYHIGVRSWASSQLIGDNTIIIPNSRKTFGISVYGKNSHIQNNLIYVENSEDHPYNSGLRSVGISHGNQSSLTMATGNITSGFNVGVGPATPSQSIPYIVRNHTSIDDTLPIDPRGLVDQFESN